MHKEISVIIPAYNAEKDLEECLSSLRKQTYQPKEIIVVDDGSTDRSAEIAEKMGAIVVRNKKNMGRGQARINGVEKASGEIFAFTDADCTAPEKWLENGIKEMETFNVQAVSGYYCGSRNNSFLSRFQYLDCTYRQKDIPKEVNSISSCNFIVTRKTYSKGGGFQPALNEDMELGYWISKKSKIHWLHNNGVIHNFRANLWKYLKQQEFFARQVMNSYIKYPEIFFSRSNYQKQSIVWELISIILLLMSIPLLFLTSYGAPLFIAVFCYSLFLKADILKFFKSENFAISQIVLSYPILLMRDMAWILGLFDGVVYTLYEKFNTSQK